MNASLRSLLSGLCGLALILAGCSGPPPDGAGLTTTRNGFTGSFSPMPLTTSPAVTAEDVVMNSLRGQYVWLNIPTDPAGWPSKDLYWRDQVQWGAQLEKRAGEYDFSSIEKGLAQVEKDRGRLGVRVMSWCPGCGGLVAPKWLPTQESGAPDWNSEAFLSAWERLMREMGDKFNEDPRLGFLDFGGYGAAGEWYHEPKYGEPITRANGKRVMKAVLDSFPDKYVMVPWVDGWPEVAMSLGSNRVGIRHDCVGADEHDYFSKDSRVQNAWRTAPMLGEWCNSERANPKMAMQNVKEFHMSMISSGNHPRMYADFGGQARDEFLELLQRTGYRLSLAGLRVETANGTTEVSTQWTNSGTAPTYDEWLVELILEGHDGKKLVVPLQDDLKKVVDEQGFVTTTATVIPESGTWNVSVRVTDREGYLMPMRLALPGRQPSGSYSLGVIDLS